MHKFYFNDCLPPCSNQYEFITHLSKTLVEFNKLTTEDLNIEKAIVTEKLPSELFLGNTYSLEDTISKIGDGSLKRLAFSYFQRYPVEAHFKLNEAIIEQLLTIDYFLPINKYNHTALNLALVHENKGFIFTSALHNDLKQHVLCLKPQIEAPDLEIDNLFGNEDNTKIIRSKIESLNAVNLSNIDQLKHELGNYTFSNQFEKDFPKLTNEEQKSIIEHFKRAKERKGITPYFADGERGLIRDVTPNNPKCNVYELRIFSPSALRVFFNESGGNVFVSHIFFKNNTDQNAAIKKAQGILNKLILTT